MGISKGDGIDPHFEETILLRACGHVGAGVKKQVGP